MMDDWQNDTCVGRYLKEINDRKIKKNKKNSSKSSAYSYSKSYGGQFHLDFPGFKDRNIFGLDGAYGQSILIDIFLMNKMFLFVKYIMRNYKLFLKKRYNKKPVIIAMKPFKATNVFASGMIRASCNQDSTANIIPNAEIKSHISFLIFIFFGSLIID